MKHMISRTCTSTQVYTPLLPPVKQSSLRTTRGQRSLRVAWHDRDAHPFLLRGDMRSPMHPGYYPVPRYRGVEYLVGGSRGHGRSIATRNQQRIKLSGWMTSIEHMQPYTARTARANQPSHRFPPQYSAAASRAPRRTALERGAAASPHFPETRTSALVDSSRAAGRPTALALNPSPETALPTNDRYGVHMAMPARSLLQRLGARCGAAARRRHGRSLAISSAARCSAHAAPAAQVCTHAAPHQGGKCHLVVCVLGGGAGQRCAGRGSVEVVESRVP